MSNPNLADAMKEHDKSGRKETVVDFGNVVICDLCNGDFTASDRRGGLLILRAARCPDCAPKTLAGAVEYGEEKYITHNTENLEFREFVLRARGGNNKAVISSF